MNLTRAKFEDLCFDLLERCKKPVEQALKDAGISKDDINEVVLVGGSSRIPAVQNWLKITQVKSLTNQLTLMKL